MENLRVNDIPHQERFEGIIEKNFESEIWQEEAQEMCGVRLLYYYLPDVPLLPSL